MANQTIPGLSSIASPASSAMLWINDPTANPQDRSLKISLIPTVLSTIGAIGNRWLAALQAALATGWGTALAAALSATWVTAFGVTLGSNWSTAFGADAHSGASNGIDANTLLGLGRTAQVAPGALLGIRTTPVFATNAILGANTQAIPAGNAVLASIYLSSGTIVYIEYFNGSTWLTLSAATAAGSVVTFTCINSTGSNYRFEWNGYGTITTLVY